MSSATASALTLAVCCMTGAAADAAPLFGEDDLQRNGAISRHLWTPDLTRTELAGAPVSVGLAVGLRPNLRSQLGSRVAPAFTIELSRRSNLSLLTAGNGGTMVVWQRQN